METDSNNNHNSILNIVNQKPLMGNRLQEEIAKKFPFNTFRPGLKLYKEINVGKVRFHRILKHEVNPTVNEMIRIAYLADRIFF